ncbi:hypothetical protein D3C76_1160310 [compost metagenome]
MGVAGDLTQGIADMPGQHLLPSCRAVPSGIEDALADQAAVCPGQARLFLGFAAGDHQPGGDLQLAQYIALLITVRRGLIQVFGRQAGDLVRIFNQTPGMGERREAHITAWFELNLVDG